MLCVKFSYNWPRIFNFNYIQLPSTVYLWEKWTFSLIIELNDFSSPALKALWGFFLFSSLAKNVPRFPQKIHGWREWNVVKVKDCALMTFSIGRWKWNTRSKNTNEEWQDQFTQNFPQRFLGWRGFRFFQMKGYVLFKGLENTLENQLTTFKHLFHDQLAQINILVWKGFKLLFKIIKAKRDDSDENPL